MAITEENINNTLQMYANPLSIQANALHRLQESVLEGKAIQDGNNVFTFLLEFMSSMTAGATGEAINNFRSLYPSKAVTASDLYKHMSDFDYINLFSTPASTKVTLLFDRNYLINHAVQDDVNIAYHRVVIPSQTKFTIGNLEFGIHYPIHILIKKNIRPDGIVDFGSTTFTVLWDYEDYNPLHILHTNIVEHRFHTVDNTTLLCIDLPIHQFSIKSYNEAISTSSGFIKRYTYTDKFYAIRVFENSTDNWVEMHQTLSDTIYDTNIPTAKIKVISDMKMVEVVIPQVYLTSGAVGNKVLIKIYTSKGKVNTDISNYDAEQFQVNFVKSNDILLDNYSDILKYINRVQIIPSVSRITGGSDGLSFAQLRERVIHDSTYDVLITPRDLNAYFSDHGYVVTKYLDNITNRIYFAHKRLLDSKGNMIGAGSYNTIFTDEMLKIVTDPYTNEKYVDNYNDIKPISDNTDQSENEDATNYTSVMLLPTNIYKYDAVKNSMRILDDVEIGELDRLDKKAKVNVLNKNIYSFVPFHTKLITGNMPVCINYDLMDPQVSNLVFDGENQSIASQVSVYSYNISHLDHGKGGYRLLINLYRTSDIMDMPIIEYFDNDVIPNILVVLSTTNTSGNTYYLVGKYISTRDDSELPIVEFKLETNYAILDNDVIHIDNLKNMYNNNSLGAYVSLDSSYKIMTFIRTGLLGDYSGSLINQSTSGFPAETSDYTWLSTQTMDISLGKKVDMLHNNINLAVGEAKIELHPTTTFATYKKPIYERWSKEELLPEHYDKIGLLKYPLVKQYDIGDLILSEINDHIYPPTFSLTQTHPRGTIKVYNSELVNNDVEGTYYLVDERARGTERVWKKMGRILNTHLLIRFNTNLKQWVLEKYTNDVGAALYITNETVVSLVGIPDTWYLASNLNHAATLVVELKDAVSTSVHNLSLAEPYTATSWQGNVWEKTDGDVYVYGSSNSMVNGNYYLISEVHRQWEKILIKDDDTITHRIKLIAGTEGQLSRWELSEQVNTATVVVLCYAIDLNPTGNPWHLDWESNINSDIIPKFHQINQDTTNHRVIVKDMLELLHSRIHEHVIFEHIKDLNKTIDKDTFVIRDPAKEGFAVFVINSDNDINEPSTILDPIYIDPLNSDKRVGAGNGAIYIRDLEIDNFNPLDYISDAQLYELFDIYDHSDNTSMIEDDLARRYSVSKYIVNKILAWRSPWVKVLAVTDMLTLQKFLNTRVLGNHNLFKIREIQNLCFEPLKRFNDYETFDAVQAQISGSQVVWLEDVKNAIFDHSEPIFGSDYSDGHKGALVYMDDGESHVVCYATDMLKALSVVQSHSSYNGLVYCVYDKRDTVDYTLRYIYPLTVNREGWECNIDKSSWQLADKWPWDIKNWIDINNSKVNETIKSSLNTVITSAIVEHGSGDAVITETGDILEDLNTRSIIYNTTLTHADYKLTLSSDIEHRDYRKKMLESLRSHFVTIDNARVSLLEQTNIFFRPIRTLGIGKFKFNNVETIDMRLDITMELRLHVEQRIISNTSLRDALEKNIHTIITKHLNEGEISQTSISRDILNEFGDSIVYVDVLGINDRADLQTIVPVSNEFSPYIRNTLYVKDDGTIGTKSGLMIKWVVIA